MVHYSWVRYIRNRIVLWQDCTPVPVGTSARDDDEPFMSDHIKYIRRKKHVYNKNGISIRADVKGATIIGIWVTSKITWTIKRISH